MKRLKALQEQSRQAVRQLAGRVESEREVFRGLVADVKGHLKALPEVATAAIGMVQARKWAARPPFRTDFG